MDVDTAALAQRVRSALEEVPLPAAVIDLEAFDLNLRALLGATAPMPVRLATKSVRCHALLRRAADALGERFAGLMTVSPREALHLGDRGWQDLLVAYPVARTADARPLIELARRGIPARQVVDDPLQIELIARLAREAGVRVPLVVDVDAATRLPGLYFGVRRSPVRSVEQVLSLARKIEGDASLSFAGVMMYEAQIAGLSDRGQGMRGGVIRWAKGRSRSDVRARRAEIVEGLHRAGLAPALVNGGGTGSAAWTAGDPAVTETTIGSGLFAPHLFDGFDSLDLRPAAFAVLPVVRRPGPEHITAHGGGYPASGAMGPDRAPQILWPPGVSATSNEGFGEVQTPLGGRVQEVGLGEVILLRHAKAGELCERFAHLHLLDGDRLAEIVPTWRGEGLDVG